MGFVGMRLAVHCYPRETPFKKTRLYDFSHKRVKAEYAETII